MELAPDNAPAFLQIVDHLAVVFHKPAIDVGAFIEARVLLVGHIAEYAANLLAHPRQRLRRSFRNRLADEQFIPHKRRHLKHDALVADLRTFWQALRDVLGDLRSFEPILLQQRSKRRLPLAGDLKHLTDRPKLTTVLLHTSQVPGSDVLCCLDRGTHVIRKVSLVQIHRHQRRLVFCLDLSELRYRAGELAVHGSKLLV
ncbi:hypothetical protein D3C76_883220 [compost metagenome]